MQMCRPSWAPLDDYADSTTIASGQQFEPGAGGFLACRALWWRPFRSRSSPRGSNFQLKRLIALKYGRPGRIRQCFMRLNHVCLWPAGERVSESRFGNDDAITSASSSWARPAPARLAPSAPRIKLDRIKRRNFTRSRSRRNCARGPARANPRRRRRRRLRLIEHLIGRAAVRPRPRWAV